MAARFHARFPIAVVLSAGLLCGCAAPGGPAAIVLLPDKTNAVAHWHDIGAVTVGSPGGDATEAERLAAFPADLATMHLAIHDALAAIDAPYPPFLISPSRPYRQASPDAAIATAAYTVLRGLFPSRQEHYQGAYERFIAALPMGEGKTEGIALGTEMGTAWLSQRAHDGRGAPLPPYAATAAPGRYRGNAPINRHWPLIKPFTLQSSAQFRPGPPPALDSARYAADYNEVRELGGAASTRRTPQQTETARFHSELPVPYFTRNFGRFARTTSDSREAARLMAVLYAGYTDAIGACFDAKYFYDTWRPLSAIPLADSDNNPATEPDPGWKPVLPSPNHPEYPAAHSCSAGALDGLLRHYYGTDKVTFTWDSKITGATRVYTSTGGLVEESRQARIWGGMHFRYATDAGAELGRRSADWTMQNAFKPLPK